MAAPRLLVTGAAGFLGWTALRVLAGRYEVIGTVHERMIDAAGVPLVRVDVTDAAAFRRLLAETRPRAVLHLAALTSVDQGEREPERFAEVNREVTGRIARVCADLGVRLVYASTDLVYGRGPGSHREDEVASPLSVYARTKLEGEEAVRRAAGDFAICRLANMYGPSGPANRCFADWMRGLLDAGREVPLYRDQFRSFLYAPDAARALAEVAENAPSGETYNLGGPERMDRLAFGRLFAEAFGLDASLLRPISIADDGLGLLRGADCSLDVAKAGALLGSPPRAPREALADWAGAA